MHKSEKRKKLIISIIKEMQAELDTFFRSKKSKKVQLSPEDILYLEVMLAQAVGSGFPAKRSTTDQSTDDAMLSGCTERFLREFFTLKTKPQVQLRASTFRLVESMVRQTVSRALRQVKDEEVVSPSSSTSLSSRSQSSQSTEDEKGEAIVVPETDSETDEFSIPSSISSRGTTRTSSSSPPSPFLSSSESVDVSQESSPKRNVFQQECPYEVTSRLFKSRRGKEPAIQVPSDISWLKKTERVPRVRRVTPESPVARRGHKLSLVSSVKAISAVPIAEPRHAEPKHEEPKRLPIKKRKASNEAIVPNLQGNASKLR